MKLNKITWAIIIIVVLIFVYRIGAWFMSGSKPVAERVIPIEVSLPVVGEIEERITLTGDIKGETEVAVRPKTVGRVEEIYVEEGDYVSQGQKLLSYVKGISPQDEIYNDVVTFAPISGVVGMKTVKEGEQVLSGIGGINPVFTVYQIGSVKIYIDVPEKYYSLVRRGLPVEILVDAIPDKVFKGRINNIQPVIDPASRTAQAEIIVPNPGRKLRPGMFSKVSLVLSKKDNALIVPTDTVLGLDGKYVFIVVGNKAVKKAVSIGIQDDGKTEIITGISPSDEVITVGQRVVDNGSKVGVVK